MDNGQILQKFKNENYHMFLKELAELKVNFLVKFFLDLENLPMTEINERLRQFLANPDYSNICQEFPLIIEKFISLKSGEITAMGIPPLPKDGKNALQEFVNDLNDKNETWIMLHLLKTMIIQVSAFDKNIPLSSESLEDRETECKEKSQYFQDEDIFERNQKHTSDECATLISAYEETLEASPQPTEIVIKTLEMIMKNCPMSLEKIDEIMKKNQQSNNPQPTIPQDDIDQTLDNLDQAIDDAPPAIEDKDKFREEIGQALDNIRDDIKDGLNPKQKQDLDEIFILLKHKQNDNLLDEYSNECKNKAKALKNKWFSLLTKMEEARIPLNLNFSTLGKLFKCIID